MNIYSDSRRGKPLNALTVDVEDYFQVAAFEKTVSKEQWENFPRRFSDNTEKLLNLFAEYSYKATFFVLGWIAERDPKLIRRIAEAGHEIASHGYDHQLVYRSDEKKFREDIRRTKELLQKITGRAIFGYRAPSWSLTARTPWAHRVLVEEGYRYDSSVFPIRHDLHGSPGARRDIHRIETEAGTIIEFPPAVLRLFGHNFPTGGGGFFRLYPYGLTRFMLRAINARERPFTFYIHPWEIDPEQPRIPDASWKSRFRHYVNLKRTESKLRRLLADFQFATMQEVLAAVDKSDFETGPAISE